jgi:superfamily II DNA or RNA helicase
MKDKRRFFNRKEKIALYLMSDGKCEGCGKPLEKGWHADHIHPHSKDGLTDITNAQALCDICNQKKGAKMPNLINLPPWPLHLKLRDWQEEALIEWETRTAPTHNFLLTATPGAGKTLFSLRLTYQLIESNRIEFVVIVCPTTHLKKQWAEKAHTVGINIDPDWINVDGTVSNEFLGIAITYQGVAASDLNTTVLRRLCSRKKTLVIFDEIHHAGEGKTWGDSINQAFDPAKHKVLLSGTPFRSDNHRIPYVNYDNNYSYADYPYGYSKALRDGVCRPVFFPSYEGTMEWLSRDGQHVSARFEDELDEQLASERLRTALDPKGDWLKDVIREAHQNLVQIRNEGHKNAGGLILAMDQPHAKAIADLVRQITGEEPTIAISETSDASKEIENFAKGSRCWIIAVRMVSEGVDIPRLRVLVYATNTATELFFRQAAGRVIRVIPELEEQSASFYMPAVDILVEYARRIKEERDHVIEEVEDLLEEEVEDRSPRELPASFFTAISSEALRDNVIFDHGAFSPEELNFAQEYARNLGYGNFPTVVFAKIMRDFNILPPSKTVEQSADSEKPLYQRKKNLRTKVATLVQKYAFMTGIPYNEVHTQWLKKGGNSQSKATEEELQRKLNWILKKIEDYGKQKGQ